MNIGDVAALSGLNPKTIRYYEARGFLQPLRSTNGYRSYRASDARRLRLLAQARKLGLSLSDCETLLDLADTGDAVPGTFMHLLEAHLDTLHQEIQNLEHKTAAVSALLEKAAQNGGDDRCLLRVLSEQSDAGTELSNTG